MDRDGRRYVGIDVGVANGEGSWLSLRQIERSGDGEGEEEGDKFCRARAKSSTEETVSFIVSSLWRKEELRKIQIIPILHSQMKVSHAHIHIIRS